MPRMATSVKGEALYPQTLMNCPVAKESSSEKKGENIFWQTKPENYNDGNFFISTLSKDNFKFFILSHGQISSYLKEKEMQEGKIVVWGGLEIAEKRREVKGKGERER